MSTNKDKKTVRSKPFSSWQIWIPVLLGLTVVGYMFWKDFNPEVWASIRLSEYSVFAIIAGILLMVGRDVGMSWRFRIITDKELSWLQSLKVCMLCEFTSCITPSAVGGSSLAVVFLNREGINMGRSTALMMTTLFLDELFFVVSCPIIFLLTPEAALFGPVSGFSVGMKYTFWIVYIVVFLWTVLLFVGLLVKPHWVQHLLLFVFRLPLLRRWKLHIEELGKNLVCSSAELKSKSLSFWIKAFGATAMSWTSRYLVVNALFLAFVAHADQWLVFARQLVVWLVLMISPTPGGSGLSEYIFTEYYSDLVPFAGVALVIAFCWRIISYYVYLIIGAFIVPGWLKDWNKNVPSV